MDSAAAPSSVPVPGAVAADPTAMRRRILNAAARLFRERGFHATTARAIAAEVGILSGSLFHHFRSKDQMLFEVMNGAATQLCEKAEAVVAAAPDPRSRLRALIQMQLECLIGADTRDYYAVLIGEWRELDPPAKALLNAHRHRYSDVWAATLEECARAGQLRADPHTMEFILRGAINWASNWFRPGGGLSLADYAGVLEDVALERPGVPAPG